MPIGNQNAVSDMSHLAGSHVDIEALRARLRKMSDAELLRFGSAAKFMCSREAQPFGGQMPPRPEFVLQLEEAFSGHEINKTCRDRFFNA